MLSHAFRVRPPSRPSRNAAWWIPSFSPDRFPIWAFFPGCVNSFPNEIRRKIPGSLERYLRTAWDGGACPTQIPFDANSVLLARRTTHESDIRNPSSHTVYCSGVPGSWVSETGCPGKLHQARGHDSDAGWGEALYDDIQSEGRFAALSDHAASDTLQRGAVRAGV